MKAIKDFFAITVAIMGALLLAPFIALFGLMMLGLAFGLSPIAAGAAAAWFRTDRAGETVDGEAEPVREADADERRTA